MEPDVADWPLTNMPPRTGECLLSGKADIAE
jgi:hypothetical protein